MSSTLKDIARRLNLSVSTVSYALNGGPKPVSEGVRTRVLATAQELGYRPNRLARSLATRKTGVLGVVPPRLHRDMMLTSFVQRAFNAIVNEAEDLRQDILLVTAFDRAESQALANDLLGARVDAVVLIAPRCGTETVDLLAEAGMPFAAICAGREVPGLSFEIDNRAAALLAMEHLAELGHRRIAHISGPEDAADGKAREAAYLGFMAEHGWPVLPGYLLGADYTYALAYRVAHEMLLLPEPPTAVFAANDDCALAVCQAAHDLGLSVPHDLTVVGFDDADAGQRMRPALTTVSQPIDAMAAAAVRAAVAAANGEPAQGAVFASRLIVRDTSAPPKPASKRRKTSGQGHVH